VVMDGGDSDCSRVNFEIGGEQFLDGREDRNCVFGRGIGGAGRVRLDGCNQGDSQPRRFQITVDTEMVAAKCAGSGNGNTENGFARYFAAPESDPLPSTAWRQRP
jgi:hypothetical protein